MGTPLVITKAEEERAAEIVMHAERHPFTIEMLRAVMKGERSKAGDRPELEMFFPMGFKVAFSIELQPEPAGRCRHLSMSVQEEGRVPHWVAVDMVLPLFGFRGSVRDRKEWLAIWEEECWPGHMAINVLQRYAAAGGN